MGHRTKYTPKISRSVYARPFQTDRNINHYWGKTQDVRLVELHGKFMSMNEIAAAMGFCSRTVHDAMKRLGLVPNYLAGGRAPDGSRKRKNPAALAQHFMNWKDRQK